MDSGLTPLTPTEVAARQKKATSESYIIRVLIAFDMMVNTIFFGEPDETISARSGRAATDGKLWGKLMVRFLNIFQKDHSALAEAGDQARAEKVAYIEGNINTSLEK